MESILNAIMLPYARLNATILLETKVKSNFTYPIIVSMFLECECPNFVDIVLASIVKREKYVKC